MKNRLPTPPTEKVSQTPRETLSQEQAVQQALLHSFEATRRPWWTTVSAGVLAVSLGMSGASEAARTVNSGTLVPTPIEVAPGVVTVAPKVVSITGTSSGLLATSITAVSNVANLEVGMHVYLSTEAQPRTITGIAGSTVSLDFPLGSGATSVAGNAMIPSLGVISADTVITQLLGSNYTNGTNPPVYPGEIRNSGVAHTITIGQGSYDGIITDGASTTGVIKDTAGILTLSGPSTYSGGTELRAGQLRAGSALAHNPYTGTPETPFGTGVIKLVAGQLSGVNGITVANPIDIRDGATTVLTLGTESDSRNNSNANTSGGGSVPIDISNEATFHLTGDVVLTDNARLNVLSSVRLGGVVSDPVTGARGITKSGEGVLRMSGASTYSGGTVLEAGELRAESNSVYNPAVIGGGASGFPLSTTSASNSVTALNASAYSIGQVVTGSGAPNALAIPEFDGSLFPLGVIAPAFIANTSGTTLTLSGAASATGATISQIDNNNDPLLPVQIRGVFDSYTASRYALGAGASVSLTGTTIVDLDNASPTFNKRVVSGVTNAASLKIGQSVSGLGIPLGTIIADIDVAGRKVTLSQDVTLAGVSDTTSVTIGATNIATGAFGTGTVVLKGGRLSGDQVLVANAVDIGVATSSATVSVELGRPGSVQAIGDGAFLDNGDRLVISGATTIRQTANISVGSQYDPVTETGYNGASVLLAGPVSGKGFTKLGGGNLWLGNYAVNVATGVQGAVVNSYTGKTIIQEGKLGITDKTDLGASTVKFTGGVLDVSTATTLRQTTVGTGYDIASVIESIDVDQNARLVGGNTTSNVTLLQDGSPNAANAAAVDVLAGRRAVFATGLSGKGGLILEGGELQVANSNSYTGATTVAPGGVLILPTKDAIASSSNIVIRGTLDGSSAATTDGFAFSTTQPVEVKADYDAATNFLNSQGVLRVKNGTSFANANLTVDIASRMGAPQTATGPYGGPSIVQTRVAVAGSSSAIPKVTVKVVPRAVYTIGVEQVESSAPVYVKDFFTAEDTAGAQITDRSRIGAVTGTLVSARPIFKLNWTKDGDALTYTRQSYGVFGQGQNGANFGAYLDKQISATSTKSIPKVLRAADSTFSEGETFTKFLNELSAQPFADMYRSGLGRSLAVLGGLEDRINSLATSASEEGASRKFGYKQVTPVPTRAAAPVASIDDEWAAWLSVYERGSTDKALASDGASKLRNDETGTQMGVERRVGNLKVGLTGATGWGRSTFDTPSTSISSDSWHVGLYTIAPINQLTLDASFMYGLTSNSSTRTPHVNVLFGDTTPDANTYHAKFDSRDLSISVGAAYNMMQPESAFQMAPVLRLTYVNYTQSAFGETEKALDGAYKVDKMDAGTFLSKLGYRVSYTTRAGSAELGADFGAYWQHDWDNSARSVNARLNGGLAGTSYAATSRRGSSDSCLLNGGLQITFSDKYTLRGSAGAEFGGDRNDLNGTVSFGIKF